MFPYYGSNCRPKDDSCSAGAILRDGCDGLVRQQSRIGKHIYAFIVIRPRCHNCRCRPNSDPHTMSPPSIEMIRMKDFMIMWLCVKSCKIWLLSPNRRIFSLLDRPTRSCRWNIVCIWINCEKHTEKIWFFRRQALNTRDEHVHVSPGRCRGQQHHNLVLTILLSLFGRPTLAARVVSTPPRLALAPEGPQRTSMNESWTNIGCAINKTGTSTNKMLFILAFCCDAMY